MTEPAAAGLPETEAQILAALDRFLVREVEPHVMALEDADEYPADIVEGMKELGLFGCVISEEHGGLGLPVTTYVRIVERICETWMSLSGIFNTHLLMAWIVERFGTAEQKTTWLPKFASGEIRGGLALTEPGCGTDLQAVRTRALRDGPDYVVNGTKTWITNGYHGDCVALLVKTDMEAEPRHRGISLFLAQKGEGFTASRKLRKLGYRGIDTAELVFEDFRIPEDRLIGGMEGLGLKQALGALELGRINVAARGVGVARRALDLAVAYAKQRQTFGKPIANHQAIQIKLADMATRLEASRHLTRSAAVAFDAGERCDMEAGMAKLHATETALFNATESMRIHGAYGYSKEFEIERLYRDAPLLVIGEGTNCSGSSSLVSLSPAILTDRVMAFPLEGVRILSVEQYAAGPFGTLALADLGAEVIRIENPVDGGDIGRRVRLAGEASGEGMSLFHQTFNRNKKSITLDLKHPRGREILHRLVARADAVFNNLRGDLPESLGLDYQALGAVKPEIVCVHLSAYGRKNERAGWPGYDYLMQAECGWLSVTGDPGGEPQRMGLSLVDYSAGLQGAVAVLAGVIGARTSGRGGDLDVSLFGTAITSLAYVATWYLSAGVETGRHPRSAHPSLTPSQLFRTRDGWIFIMCNKERFWPRLCAAIGEPTLADDPDYAGFAERLIHRDRLTGLLDRALERRTTSEWMSVFSGEVPAAPVHDVKAALDSPFARESGYILACETSTGTPVTTPGHAVRVAGSKSLAKPAPDLAHDLESVMAEIGIEGEELAALREAGVV